MPTHPSASQSFRTAHISRVVLFVAPSGLWLSADRSATGRAARAWTTGAPSLKFDIAAGDPLTWTNKPTGITGKRPCLRYDRRSQSHRIVLDYEASGGVKSVYSDNEGESWSMATTISSTGTFPTFCVTPTGAQHHFWVDAGAIKTIVVDPQGNTLVAARTVVASGVAADAITAWHNADTGAIYLEYRDSAAAIVTLRSVDDGLNFT